MMVSRASAATVTSVAMIALAIAPLIIGLHQPVLNLLFGSASPEVLESARVYLIGSSTSFIGIAIVQAVCGAREDRQDPGFTGIVVNYELALRSAQHRVHHPAKYGRYGHDAGD